MYCKRFDILGVVALANPALGGEHISRSPPSLLPWQDERGREERGRLPPSLSPPTERAPREGREE